MSGRRTAGAALAAVAAGGAVRAGAGAGGRRGTCRWSAADFLGIGGLVSGVFSSVGHAVLGAFSWTVGLAGKFILVTIGALVHC